MNIDLKECAIRIKVQRDSVFAAIDDVSRKAPAYSRISVKEYNGLKPYIKILQDEVLAYFELQRSCFWDLVSEEYSCDSEVLKVIEFLRISLRDAKIKSLDFLEEHPADMGELNSKDFHSDFMMFSTMISGFISEETKYLLPLLENLSCDR